MKIFESPSTHPARAVQAWQILIGKAMNRQLLTYEGLSLLMYEKEAAGVLDEILGHIAFYCHDNSLPPLTVLVVNKHSGRPGAGIPIDPATIDERREEVYRYNWFKPYPPSERELADAHQRHVKP
jgi:hypothetical protein